MMVLPNDPSNVQDPDSSVRGNKRPAPRGTAAYPRKRAVTACQVCRARRTKCDNLKPSCSFCLKVGAQCIQSAADLSSFDPASLKILERLDDLESLIHSAQAISQDQSVRAAESQAEALGSDVSTQLPHDLCLLPPGLETVLLWPSLILEEESSDGNLLHTTRQLRSGRESGVVDNQSPASSVTDLEPQTTRVLVDSFFNYVHVKNPVLDELATRRTVSRLALHGVDWTAQSCLALLVCALGALATPFGDSESVMPGTTAYATAQSFFSAAQKRLGPGLITGGLVPAQCFFLSGIYLICIFRPVHAWRLFTQALACCQDFDFLTVRKAAMVAIENPSEEETSTANISQAEQAIYWSAWKSQQELRWELELNDFPMTLADRTLYPAFFPTPPPPRSNESYHSTDQAHIQRERTSWFFYLTEISLRRLASRILSTIDQCRPRAGEHLLKALARQTPSLEEQAEEWSSALPPDMTLTSSPAYDDICKFVIRGHLVNIYETIYWPFVDAVINNKIQVDITRPRWDVDDPEIIFLVEKGLHNHVERVQVNKPGFRHRHHGTLGLARACTRSCLVLLAAARNTQGITLSPTETRRDDMLYTMPNGWQQAVTDVIGLNEYWSEESPDAAKRYALLRRLASTVGIS